ncbi:DsbA family protein [Acidimangrovimonas sediminis]|uniref:DsbA family protein n=1 Tax=Acidimangrovimonas sediminis TaxID=2056283 RepID=UPI000C806233|nr:DsbA family protein [Acidimangrovimonas sediminis]
MTRPARRPSAPRPRLLLAATLGLALAGAGALPRSAAAEGFDLSQMTPDQKAAFGKAVHDYLMEHPEVLVEAYSKLQEQQAQQQAADDESLVKANANALFHDPNSWVGGNPKGDITLVEFMDYRCGYCKKAMPEVAKLLKTDGKIRYIVKEFPILTEQSVIGARFAIATRQVAGDAAYAKVHDALMAMRGPINEASLKALADTLDLDYDAISARTDSASVNKVIAENHALAARLKINGTPTFVLGGDMLRGYVPYDQLKEIVAEIRTDRNAAPTSTSGASSTPPATGDNG